MRMFTIFIYLILTCIVNMMPLFAQENIDNSRTISQVDAGHSFEFTITRVLFDSTKHDISEYDRDKVDGKEILGTDGSIPRYEIESFLLKIDGIEVSIPSKIYDIFYNPSLSSRNLNAFWANDYNSVFIYMNGSDGAGAFSVTWFLNKNGNHAYSLIPIYDMYFNFNE